MARFFCAGFVLMSCACQAVIPDFKVTDDAGDTHSDSSSDDGNGSDSTDSGTDSGGSIDDGQPGSACSTASDCLSNYCNRNICCAAGSCCSADEQCLASFACSTVDYSCYETCNEAGVELDERCANGYHCEAGACFADIATGPCDEHSDCASGECIDSQCCEHAGLCCASDGDCPEWFNGCDTAFGSFSCAYIEERVRPSGQQGQCFSTTNALVPCNQIGSSGDLFGQDGHYPPPDTQFVPYYWEEPTDGGGVGDSLSGLVWTAVPGDIMRFEDALFRCDNMSLDAFNNWRLPTRLELFNLVSYENRSGIGLDALFDVKGASQMWTSTTLAGSREQTVWTVNVDTGQVLRSGVASQNSVLCVREGE